MLITRKYGRPKVKIGVISSHAQSPRLVCVYLYMLIATQGHNSHLCSKRKVEPYRVGGRVNNNLWTYDFIEKGLKISQRIDIQYACYYQLKYLITIMFSEKAAAAKAKAEGK